MRKFEDIPVLVETILLLGSNMGNRILYLKQAKLNLSINAGIVKAESAYYKTAPWGGVKQPDFLNQAIVLATNLPPLELLTVCKNIEQLLGRKRTQKWGQRSIDIDILLYGDLIFSHPDLMIPHPELPNRRFALEPVAEIRPNLMHPQLNQTVLNLLELCPDSLMVEQLK